MNFNLVNWSLSMCMAVNENVRFNFEKCWKNCQNVNDFGVLADLSSSHVISNQGSCYHCYFNAA